MMDSKEFKNVFDEVAKSHGFSKAFGAWFKESPEAILVLELQKSKFGDYYELNIKIFVQGMFGNTHHINKNLAKKEMGDIFTRQPQEFSRILNFDEPITDEKRKEELERLFLDYVNSFTNKALFKAGIKELADHGLVFLLPAVKEQLLNLN
ncbi:DUF4304 domain-containing protein [Pedobacter sp. KR3-3]|uniref:DUF4304 domain-containing protein n=1 Tax=Pedobacter albus TaxID=3113905 RepID=A0ABU7I2Q4_9SPHI|nr:DUF4304 domain-containing protein [Pedobacter sp. KR3-3]MEE1943687.1 DUF4304 domain-containing protein [Pedobacter sp. KR3-3]